MSKSIMPVPEFLDITVIDGNQRHQMIPVEREVFEASEQSRHSDNTIRWGARNIVQSEFKTFNFPIVLELEQSDQKKIAKHATNLALQHSAHGHALVAGKKEFSPGDILPAYIAHIGKSKFGEYVIGVVDDEGEVCNFDGRALLSYPRYMQSLPYDEKDCSADSERNFVLQQDYIFSGVLSKTLDRIATSNIAFFLVKPVTDSSQANKVIDVADLMYCPIVKTGIRANHIIGTCYGKTYWKNEPNKTLPKLFYKDGRIVEPYLYRHNRRVLINVHFQNKTYKQNFYWSEIIDCILNNMPALCDLQNNLIIKIPLDRIDHQIAKFGLSIKLLIKLFSKEREILGRVDQLLINPQLFEQERVAIELDFKRIDDALLKLPCNLDLGNAVLYKNNAFKSQLFHDDEKANHKHMALCKQLEPYKKDKFKIFMGAIADLAYSKAVRILANSHDPKKLNSDDPNICYQEDEEVIQCLKILLSFAEPLSIDLNERAGKEEQTASHYAAMRKNPQIYQLLRDHKANTDLPNKKGQTAAQLYALHCETYQPRKDANGLN